MDLEETGWGGGELIQLPDRGRQRAVVNAVMNLRVLYKIRYIYSVTSTEGWRVAYRQERSFSHHFLQCFTLTDFILRT
jgi:hypothetical protein